MVKAKAPEVAAEVQAGTKTLGAAVREVKKREERAEDELLDRALGNDAAASEKVARSRLRAAYSNAIYHVLSDLLPLKPEAVAAIIDTDQRGQAARLRDNVDQWFARLDRAYPKAMQIVGGNNGDRE